MHERNEHIDLIDEHHACRRLGVAALLPGMLSALATRLEDALQGRIIPIIVSALMMPVVAALQAQRAPRRAT